MVRYRPIGKDVLRNIDTDTYTDKYMYRYIDLYLYCTNAVPLKSCWYKNEAQLKTSLSLIRQVSVIKIKLFSIKFQLLGFTVIFCVLSESPISMWLYFAGSQFTHLRSSHLKHHWHLQTILAFWEHWVKRVVFWRYHFIPLNCPSWQGFPASLPDPKFLIDS